MKNLILLIAAVTMAFYSCKPIYQCGQTIPEKTPRVSKRVQAVIDERDDLCRILELRDNEISDLKGDIIGPTKDVVNFVLLFTVI